MAKGYWIPQIDVSNPEGYKTYMAATPPAHEKYHGTALVRGGRMDVVEGSARSRVVLREFPDYAAALACYRSPEYQAARPLRLQYSQCDFIIVEGSDDTDTQQPAPPAAAARKGYWIVQMDVSDPEGYKPYMAAAPAVVRPVRQPLPGSRRQPRDHRGQGTQPRRWCWSFRATTRR